MYEFFTLGNEVCAEILHEVRRLNTYVALVETDGEARAGGSVLCHCC